MDNEKAVEGLVAEVISPLIERVITKKLTQILDVAVKHERGKLAAAEAKMAELEEALASLVLGDESTIRKAYAEGFQEGSDFASDFASDFDWNGSLAKKKARRAAALLKEQD